MSKSSRLGIDSVIETNTKLNLMSKNQLKMTECKQRRLRSLSYELRIAFTQWAQKIREERHFCSLKRKRLRFLLPEELKAKLLLLHNYNFCDQDYSYYDIHKALDAGYFHIGLAVDFDPIEFEKVTILLQQETSFKFELEFKRRKFKGDGYSVRKGRFKAFKITELPLFS